MSKFRAFGGSLLGITALCVTLALGTGSSSAKLSSSRVKASAAASKPITVAVITDETGFFSANNGVDGALAYFKAANAAGGVDGRKIQIKEYDSGSSPTMSLQAVRRAISAKPAAILSASCCNASAIPTLAASGIPAIGEGFSPGWTGHKTLFSPLGDISGHISDAWLVSLKRQGEHRIALLTSPLEAPVTNQLAAEAASAGVTIVLKDESLPAVMASTDALAAAQQIQSSGAGGVVIFGLVGGALVQGDLSQLGSKAKVLETSEAGPAVIQEFGSKADGMEFGGVFASAYTKDDPGVTDYVTAMKKAGYTSQTYEPYPILRYGQAKMLVEQGLEPAGAPFKASAIIKSLAGLKNYTADGIFPPVSFPAFQKDGSACLSVAEVVNSKWQALKSGATPWVCANPSLPIG